MAALNDVSDAFGDWLEKVKINRAGEGEWVDGSWVSGDSCTITILAVVQNAKPDDLIVVPEGLRTTESIKLHTKAVLKTLEEVGETNADIITTIDNKMWRVYNVSDRRIGGYKKAIAIRTTI